MTGLIIICSIFIITNIIFTILYISAQRDMIDKDRYSSNDKIYATIDRNKKILDLIIKGCLTKVKITKDTSGAFLMLNNNNEYEIISVYPDNDKYINVVYCSYTKGRSINSLVLYEIPKTK